MNYFDLLKSKHGLPVSDAYTALLGKKPQGGGYPVTEIFGQLPFSFLSRGAPIQKWTLYGKTQQSGTPTPTSQIPVQGVGDLVESGEHAGKYAVEITNNGNTVATIFTDQPLYGTGTSLDYLQRLADGSGVEHREWYKLVIDGTENWTSFDQSGTTLFRCDNSLTGKLAESTVNTMTCNCLKVVSSRGECASTSNSISVYNTLSDSRPVVNVNPMTLSEWTTFIHQQYAAGTPVTIVYQLATPTDTPVTLPEIPTAVGTNTLTTDTTVHGDARIKGRIEEV